MVLRRARYSSVPICPRRWGGPRGFPWPRTAKPRCLRASKVGARRERTAGAGKEGGRARKVRHGASSAPPPHTHTRTSRGASHRCKVIQLIMLEDSWTVRAECGPPVTSRPRSPDAATSTTATTSREPIHITPSGLRLLSVRRTAALSAPQPRIAHTQRLRSNENVSTNHAFRLECGDAPAEEEKIDRLPSWASPQSNCNSQFVHNFV